MEEWNHINDLVKEFAFLNFKKNYNRLKEIGLYPGQDQIIDYLANHEGVCQKDICLFTGREAATITKTIQRLIGGGYILKIDDSKDKRISHLYLTELGKNTYQKMLDLKKENINYIKNILSEEELKSVENIFQKICNKMKGDMKNEANI